ncbi:uncharacterized protein LOC142172096 [Nicotiana tabacum]|uniref:Uncharacterized protein LOC142172096 n=1 Tax=Nicotiana tabacum TaxID=4097 RepID=A0AC58T423_TOBAC
MKLLLINDGTSFEEFINKICEVIEFDRNKNDPYYKGCKFVVDISELLSETFNGDQQQEGNHNVPEEQLMLISEIPEEQHMPISEITMENESVIPVKDQHFETLHTIEGRKRKAKGKAKESPSIILKENASLDDVKLGSVFQDKNAMIRYFCLAAIKDHFEFYVEKSSNTRYSLVCTDEKCVWTVRGSRIKESTLFKIVKFQRTHECSIDIRKSHQRQATSNVIRDYMIYNLRDIATEVKPKFVILEMKIAHGIDVGYGKAWRAIQKGISLLRGTTEENYDQLSSYLYMMEQKNPGSYTTIKRDAENRELRKAIGIRKNLMFLSDQHKAIANRIANCFPKCYHGICIYHLEKNLKQRRVRNTVINLFQSAARVYIQSEFHDFMSQIAIVDKKTFDYLMEESPGKWARSHCPRRRYDMLTTNIVESMNNVLRRARELPVLTMMDIIQEKLQIWFYERRTVAEGIFRKISNWAEATLDDKIKPAFTFRVLPIDRLKFKVK